MNKCYELLANAELEVCVNYWPDRILPDNWDEDNMAFKKFKKIGKS